MLVMVRLEHCERLTTLMVKPCGDPFCPLTEGLKFPLPVNARINSCRVAIHPSGFSRAKVLHITFLRLVCRIQTWLH